MHSYLSRDGSQSYLKYLASSSGQIQQNILWQVICQQLPQNPTTILDAGCGNGWLTNLIKNHYPNSQTEGCDSSPFLIKEAKTNFPEINFQISDLQNTLPYPQNHFDVIIANMVLHDIPNLSLALKNLSGYLTNSGVIIATIPNPYYAFPVGVWKRGISKLWNSLPKLKVIPENYFKFANKKITWNKHLQSYFYPLSDYFNAGQQAGLYIQKISDVHSKASSPQFNLHYQLHQFPILVVVVFKKLN